MTKRYLYWEEAYPEYGIADTPGDGSIAIEMNDEDFAEWKAVERAYNEWQERLGTMRRSAGK